MVAPLKLRSVYVVPRGTFQFIEDGMTLSAETPQRLIAKVEAYRTANRLPPGNPGDEVIQKLCLEYAEMGHPAPPPTEPAATESDDTPPEAWTLAVRDNLLSYANLAPKFCAPAETLMRVRVCEGCPHNKSVGWEGSESDVLKISRGGTLKYPDMKGCECWGHHNALAIFLTDYHAKGEPMAEVPENCWAKPLTT